MPPTATDISVVIPTYNRASMLGRALEHLEAQTVGTDRFDVVVVDDASTDATPDVGARWESSGRLLLTFVRAPKGYAGAARNRGARLARGRRLLFLGDDVLAAPDLIESHLAAEARHGAGAAFVGKVALDRTRYSCFMKFLEDTGTHHDFPRLARLLDQPLPGWYFYACNASLPRHVHDGVGGFDESLHRAYEDGDYGFRITRAGCPLFYVPDATGTHVHYSSVADYWRFLRSGRSDIARVTEKAVAAGEPAPLVGSRPVADRLDLDRVVGLTAAALARVDVVLPEAVRHRLYRGLLSYERRQAYREAGVGSDAG